jgi:leader peptidase (prepilin peptidase) / N-methyltransferase
MLTVCTWGVGCVGIVIKSPFANDCPVGAGALGRQGDGVGVRDAFELAARRAPRMALVAAVALCLLPFGARQRPIELVLSVLLAVTLAGLAVIDLDEFRLPDVLTLPLIVVGVCFVPPHTMPDALMRAAAAAVGYGLLSAVARGYHKLRGHAGLGLGDAKLYGAAGAWLLFDGLAPVLLLAALTALAGVAWGAMRGRDLDRLQAVAFGPYLAAGFWLTWLFGDWF